MEEKTHSHTVDKPRKGKQAASPKDDEYEVVYEVVYETDSEGSSDQNSSDEEVEYEYVTEIVDEKGNVIREEPTPQGDSSARGPCQDCREAFVQRRSASEADSPARPVYASEEC